MSGNCLGCIRLILHLFFALASTACKDSSLVSPSALNGGAHEVWVSPNIGSRDFLDLFSNTVRRPRHQLPCTPSSMIRPWMIDSGVRHVRLGALDP